MWFLTPCLAVRSVPQDFSYLSEKSVIRSIVDFITEAGKKGLINLMNPAVTLNPAAAITQSLPVQCSFVV